MKRIANIKLRPLALLFGVILAMGLVFAYFYVTGTLPSGEEIVLSVLGKDSLTKAGLTFSDLMSMSSVEGLSSYQNNLGNWRGYGSYRGVLVFNLLELVGGMSYNDTVMVSSEDGYNQTFCSNNVCNTWPDASVQGEMILAFSYNGTLMPDWQDGLMIVFLPPDGAYSNDDCLNTSCLGQGCSSYLSGGSRWVRNVVEIKVEEGPSTFSFAVLGDSQGNSVVLEQVFQETAAAQPSFIIHLGDMVSLADQNLYNNFIDTTSVLSVPLYKTPGNHDIKGDESLYYTLFGSGNYSFHFEDWLFIAVDTSRQSISDDQFLWLESTLDDAESENVFVFTYVPPFDPIPEGDHTFLNSTQAERFKSLMSSHNVQAVAAGHRHLYNTTRVDNADYIVSGGAGANLHAPPSMGGFRHFVLFNVRGSSLSFRPMKVQVNISSPSIEVSGRWGNITLHLEDLEQMNSTEAYSSFQNFYGNWRGQGTYRGVAVSDIINLVGGVEPSDLVVVEATDGYSQVFCQTNVNPNASWLDTQGLMILAVMFNGTSMPDWSEGFRIAFLPPDGAYSNDDCLNTSCLGQGCSSYLSGGSRWIGNVARIMVVASAV